MSEERTGGIDPNVNKDADPEKGTEPIADDANKEETQQPAHEGEVGGPDELDDRTE